MRNQQDKQDRKELPQGNKKERDDEQQQSRNSEYGDDGDMQAQKHMITNLTPSPPPSHQEQQPSSSTLEEGDGDMQEQKLARANLTPQPMATTITEGKPPTTVSSTSNNNGAGGINATDHVDDKGDGSVLSSPQEQQQEQSQLRDSILAQSAAGSQDPHLARRTTTTGSRWTTASEAHVGAIWVNGGTRRTNYRHSSQQQEQQQHDNILIGSSMEDGDNAAAANNDRQQRLATIESGGANSVDEDGHLNVSRDDEVDGIGEGVNTGDDDVVVILSPGEIEEEYRLRVLNQEPLVEHVESVPTEARNTKRRKYVMYMSITVLLLLAIIVSVVLSTTAKDEEPLNNPSKEGNTVSVTTTVPPSPSPTYAPLTTEQQELLDYLVSISPDNGTVLLSDNHRSTPQYKAFEWLIYGNDDGSGPVNADRLHTVQFFAYVTLYYSTNGPDWFLTDNWLSTSNSHVCNWARRQPSTLCPTYGSEHLGLGGNNLVGTIPGELGLVSTLTDMDLSTNVLSGSIPYSLFEKLTKCIIVSLEENQLSGSIPTSIGYLVNLSILYLQDNLLSGSLPTEIGLLEVLNEIDISHNKGINGHIPTEVGLLTNLNRWGKSRLIGYILSIHRRRLGWFVSSFSIVCHRLPSLSRSFYDFRITRS